MGGWVSELTQDTEIHPSTVKRILPVVETFIDLFNEKRFNSNPSTGFRVGSPLGSSAYYEVDDESTVYGDIDIQIINQAVVSPMFQRQIFYWNIEMSKLDGDELQARLPCDVAVDHTSSPGHLFITLDNEQCVQVDLLLQTHHSEDWGKYRATGERGRKGLLNGNLFSTLGDVLRMSIQYEGVVYKMRDGIRIPYNRRADCIVLTLTKNIEMFVLEILFNEVKSQNILIDGMLLEHPGVDISDVKLENMVQAVCGLARSFELNNLYNDVNEILYTIDKTPLQRFNNADEFIEEYIRIYTAKINKDINNTKRDKAKTAKAIARAEQDVVQVTEGLEYVLGLFKKHYYDLKVTNESIQL